MRQRELDQQWERIPNQGTQTEHDKLREFTNQILDLAATKLDYWNNIAFYTFVVFLVSNFAAAIVAGVALAPVGAAVAAAPQLASVFVVSLITLALKYEVIDKTEADNFKKDLISFSQESQSNFDAKINHQPEVSWTFKEFKNTGSTCFVSTYTVINPAKENIAAKNQSQRNTFCL